MANIILIPGAWHGAWCWRPVMPLLQQMGHRVLAPELIGMGEDRARAAEGSLARWADQVADIVRGQDSSVFLTGHSRGGTVISEVAERVPERIASLIYVSAFLLPDGLSIHDQLRMADRGADAVEVRPEVAADGTCTLTPDEVRQAFYNTTPPELAAEAARLVGPEPMVSLGTPVHVTAANFGRVPRAYIECRYDQAVPLAVQRQMQAVLPCAPVVTLDSDHSPFYSLPEALARALDQICR